MELPLLWWDCSVWSAPGTDALGRAYCLSNVMCQLATVSAWPARLFANIHTFVAVRTLTHHVLRGSAVPLCAPPSVPPQQACPRNHDQIGDSVQHAWYVVHVASLPEDWTLLVCLEQRGHRPWPGE